MKITIITISYNASDIIEKTMLSVLNQDYDDFEYIIVDGKSSDGTTDKIINIKEKFCKKNIPFRFISEKDNGISDAFNKGISMARGEYIGLINCGDSLLPNSLLKLSAYLDDCYQIIYGNIIWVDVKRKIEYVRKSKPNKLKNIRNEMCIMHPSVFVRKDVYEKYGVFDINYKYCMDQELMARFYYNKLRFFYVDIEISQMTSGGISDTQIYRTLQETKKVAKKYGASFITREFYFLKKLIFNKLSHVLKKIRKR